MGRADGTREAPCPPALGPFTAPIPHRQGQHLAARGVHGAPDPRRVSLLRHNAGQVIRCHLPACQPDGAGPGAGLGREMIRPGLKAREEPPPSPCELAPHGAAEASSRKPLPPYAVEPGSGLINEAVWCAAVDKRTAAAMALMVLCAVMDVARFLVLGRLPPWTQIAAHQRRLLTSAGGGSVWGQQEHGLAWQALHGVRYPSRRVAPCSR
jgi:hypothetical protein